MDIVTDGQHLIVSGLTASGYRFAARRVELKYWQGLSFHRALVEVVSMFAPVARS